MRSFLAGRHRKQRSRKERDVRSERYLRGDPVPRLLPSVRTASRRNPVHAHRTILHNGAAVIIESPGRPRREIPGPGPAGGLPGLSVRPAGIGEETALRKSPWAASSGDSADPWSACGCRPTAWGPRTGRANLRSGRPTQSFRILSILDQHGEFLNR